MYALAIYPEEPRCLTAISMTSIAFNIGSYMLFDTEEEARAFKEKWKGHFFNIDSLVVIKVVKK